MKQKLQLIFFLLFFILSGYLKAQVSIYTFSESTSTFTPITGGTVVATATAASGAGSLDDIVYNLPTGTIPFTFTFDGTGYTGLNISTNGFLTFGATPPATSGSSTGYAPISGTTAYSGAVSAFGGDNNSLFNILGNTGEIRYETIGVSPNQEFVVQWKNFRPFSTSTSTTLFWRWNFQIRLHQNGVVNIVYDANSVGSPTSNTRQVGIRGPNNTFPTNINNRLITSGTHTWNSSVAGTANSSTCAFSTTLLPASGKTFTFTPPVPCAGTPSPGNTVGPLNACSGVNFTLSLQNATSGTGVTYLWQSADDADFSVNLTNLGTSSTQLTSQTTAKYYRCQVTCAGNTGISNPLLVGINPFYLCYCSAVPISIDGQGATNITIASLSNPNISTSPYQNFTNLTTTDVTEGVSYSTTVTLQTGFTYRVLVFIDTNRDGDFTDLGEMNDLGLATNANPTSITGNVVIPNGATPGITGMRLVVTDNDTNTSSCYNGSFGNVEDYLVNIIPNPPCAGTPTPGNTIASSSNVCSGAIINLTLQNFTSGTGVTYQWYDNNGLIEGATNASYAATVNDENTYYCEVTCNVSSSTASSTPITITIAPNPEGGEASGPTTALTGIVYNYTTDNSVGNLQWQFATTISGPYNNIPGPTSTTPTVDVSFGSAGTFFIRCKAFGVGCPDAFSNVITTVVTLVNDNVCDALNLNVGTNGQFTNGGATVQPEEVKPPGTNEGTDCVSQSTWCNQNLNFSVWFKFTPAYKGKFDFALSPTLFDSQFALWAIGECSDFSSFSLIAANDDISGSPFNSKILPVCLEEGVTYYLQVDSYSSTSTFANWGISVTGTPAVNWYVDADNDGFGLVGSEPIFECDQPEGYEANNSDCDDSNSDINPEATEVCDYVDNDCDESIDEGTLLTFYVDADNDSYGNAEFDTLDCSAPLGYVANDDDCDDSEMTTNPQAAEQCDEVDNNCNGYTDEGCGCTDETAHNYNSEATIDDGSCETCSDGIKNADEVNVDCGGSNPNCPTCPPPTAVCGNIITVYTGGGAADYNGPGASDIWNIPAEDFDAGSIVYGSLLNQQVKRKFTNIAFNWTTNGACLDVAPNGVYNNNDKGLVWRDCLPVAPADFNKVRNFEMTITDQFGTSACEGRYIVIHSAPPGGSAPVNINYDQALSEVLDNDEDIAVYPNPGIDQIFIKTNFSDDIEKSVIITDITGRQVLKINKLDSSLINIDTQSLSLGTYTITLNSANGTKSIKWLKVQ